MRRQKMNLAGLTLVIDVEDSGPDERAVDKIG